MTQTNTKRQGVARIIIFPFSKGFKAVCLDFDLIEEAKTREEVEKEIRLSVMAYVENICRNNLSDDLLNRHADPKYWKMFENYQKFITLKRPTETFTPNIKASSFFSVPVRSLCPA